MLSFLMGHIQFPYSFPVWGKIHQKLVCDNLKQAEAKVVVWCTRLASTHYTL